MAESTTSDDRDREQQAPRLRDREARAVLEDGGYALAGVTHDAVGFLRGLPERLGELRQEAPERISDLRSEVPDRVDALRGNARAALHNQRKHYEARVRELRDRTSEEVDAGLRTLEQELDRRAADGRRLRDELRSDERVATVEDQFDQIARQAEATRRQLKAALTSVRRTAGVALDAGREQAQTARAQVKAAATSARKSAKTIVEAGRTVAG